MTTYDIPVHRRTPLEKAIYTGEKITSLQAQIAALGELRRDAVREMARTMTYREIGAELGISTPRVSQIVGNRWRKAAKRGCEDDQDI